MAFTLPIRHSHLYIAPVIQQGIITHTYCIPNVLPKEVGYHGPDTYSFEVKGEDELKISYVVLYNHKKNIVSISRIPTVTVYYKDTLNLTVDEDSGVRDKVKWTDSNRLTECK